MPPRTALFEVATRRNNYVCRSCVTALGLSQPATRFIRSYARGSRGTNGARATKESASTQPLKDSLDDRLIVNYFEKDPESGHVTRIADEEDDGEGEPDFEDLEELQANMMAKMAKVEATMGKLSKFNGVLEGLVQKHGPPGAVEALEEALASYDNDNDTDSRGRPRLWKKEGPIFMDESRADSLGWRGRQKENACAMVNKWIRLSKKALTLRGTLEKEHIAKTFMFFENLTSAIILKQAVVSRETWDDLWTIVTFDGPQNVHRLHRIRNLYKVMLQAGVSLSNEQQLLALEATFENGGVEEALELWRRLAVGLGNQDSALATAYWELGVRMYSNMRDVQRAERASRALFDRSSSSNPADGRVLLHLIEAYCAKPETAEKAFLLYRRMRELATKLEKPMRIEEYDDVIALFLASGHTDYAMFTFTDMMFAGTLDLYGKARLPNQLRNYFFFGKWLKRLIGNGDLDGAYKVLVFMQQNGIMAASIQVNGLVGAWLRTQTASNYGKAERLAWAMIRSRKSFVDVREQELVGEWPVQLSEKVPDKSADTNPDLNDDMVARATAETFVILAQKYRERGLFTKLEELFVAYQECKMPGDAMMMNELMAAAVAQNRGDKARELYQLMVHEHGIPPSADTFTILFSSLPVNLIRGACVKPVHQAESKELGRAVFRDMLSNSWMYLGHPRAAKGFLSEAQAKLVLHSFRKAADWAGMSAALMGLRDVMRFRISRITALELLAEVEGIERPTHRMAKAAIRATLKLQQLLEGVQQRGPLIVHGPAESVKDPKVLYHILLDHYHNRVQSTLSEERGAGRLIKQAKREMGVYPTD